MENKKISYGEESDLDLKLLIGIMRVGQSLHKRGSEIFKKGGLTTSQFAVLEILYHKGDLKIGEIMEKILSTGGNMTVVIKNLEKSKLIEKKCDPIDKRASLIHLTEEGRKKIEEIFPKNLEDLSVYMNVLTIEEKENLRLILKKLGTR